MAEISLNVVTELSLNDERGSGPAPEMGHLGHTCRFKPVMETQTKTHMEKSRSCICLLDVVLRSLGNPGVKKYHILSYLHLLK